jgi:hypothetical protein
LVTDLEADPELAQREDEDQSTDSAADDGDVEPAMTYAIAGVRAGATAKS